MRYKKYLNILLIAAVTLSLLVGCSANTPTEEADINDGEQNGQEAITLQVTDKNGKTQEIELTGLEAVSGEGGFKKSTGTIVGPATFSGPLLEDIMKQVGNITPQDALEITASDGYTMTFSYEQMQGHILTSKEDGQAIKIGDLDVLIALESTDSELSKGLPRIVFTGSDSPLTDGHFWIKSIAQIKVVPATSEWQLNLSGIETAVIDRSTFESTATCTNNPHPSQKFEITNKDGTTAEYEGVPLWVLLSTVDGGDDVEGHYRFNRKLSKQGYTVQVIAKDGYTAELSSADTSYNDEIILAYRKNGEPLSADEGPLKLTGPGLTSKKHNVKQVVEIKLTELPE